MIYFHTEKKIFFYLMKAVSSVIFHIICRKKRIFFKVSYFVCVILLCDYFYVLNSILYLFCTPQKILHWDTICSRSFEPIYIVTYLIKWGKTSWTDSIVALRSGSAEAAFLPGFCVGVLFQGNRIYLRLGPGTGGQREGE